jgi:RNA polymerase sigma factor (TIGR02999 family)
MPNAADQPRTQVTQILARINAGQREAASQLLPLVYDELRRLAQARLAKEAPGQTLQPTALVHEAYLRLVDDGGKGAQEETEKCGTKKAAAEKDAHAKREVGRFANRAHFFAAAAEAMRRILVERARRRAAGKHGGGRQRVPLMDIADRAGGGGGGGGGGGWSEPEPAEMLALDDALQRLAASDRRLSEVVMFRYFAGLTIEQTAEAMSASPATVKRDWNYARAWLFDQVAKEAKE